MPCRLSTIYLFPLQRWNVRGLILETLFSDNDALISQDAGIEMTFQDTGICYLQIHTYMFPWCQETRERTMMASSQFLAIPMNGAMANRERGIFLKTRVYQIKARRCPISIQVHTYKYTPSNTRYLLFLFFFCFRFPIWYSVMYFFFFFFLSSIEVTAETANALNDDDFWHRHLVETSKVKRNAEVAVRTTPSHSPKCYSTCTQN